MKKNFLFLMVLVLGVALTGCGGGGGATDAPTAAALVFAGNAQMNAAGLNSAPGRNLAPNRFAAQLYDAILYRNGAQLESTALGTAGKYQFSPVFPNGIDKYRIGVRPRGASYDCLSKIYGKVKKPLGSRTLSNVINEDTTAKAVIADNDTTGVVDALEFDPDSNTDAVDTTIAQVFATELPDITSQVKAVVSTVKNATTAAQVNAVLNNTLNLANIQTLVSNAVTAILSDPVLKPLVVAQVPTVTFNGTAITLNNATVDNITSATQTTVTTTKLETVPVVESVSVDGKTLWSKTGGFVSGVIISNLNPTFTVTFSKAVTAATNSSAMFSVLESSSASSSSTTSDPHQDMGAYIYQTIYHGSGSYGTPWANVFDTTLGSLSNATSFTFTVKTSSSLKLANGKYYTVSLSSWSGFYNGTLPLIVPALSGQFFIQ